MEEIDLRDFWELIKSKVLLIINCTLICTIAGLVYLAFINVPMYKSTTSVILASNQTITQSDLTLYQKLINTYTQIVTSKSVLNDTISDLNLVYSYDELKSKVVVNAVTDTEIITISVGFIGISYL